MNRENIRFDFSHMMSDMLGMNYGIDDAEVDAIAMHAARAHAAVEASRGKGWLGWMDLPYNQDAIVDAILQKAAHIRDNFEAFVVLGIGGSALGPLAVHNALRHLRYNELPKEKRGGPKLYVEDNIDPERMVSLLDVIDVEKTCFNVITKSGGTAETMSQFMIIREMLESKKKGSAKLHIIATTGDDNKSLLKVIADREGYDTFFVPDGVGGRFSELCPVGLLPAAVCGVDIRALLDGARDMDRRLKAEPAVWSNPALLSAALAYIAMEDRGINVSVMLPYADSLRTISDWYCQLWAESLGKNVTRKGMAVNAGQTPVKSLGVTDQHSQLQLYTEGPYDKMITLLKVGKFRSSQTITPGIDYVERVAFLGGRTLDELIEAERQGTEYALYRAGRMSQTIELPEVNEYTVGQLLYFFEMVTAYAGELLDIDAFNQPGVEESKRASFAVLGHPDFAAKKAEMATRPARAPKYML